MEKPLLNPHEFIGRTFVLWELRQESRKTGRGISHIVQVILSETRVTVIDAKMTFSVQNRKEEHVALRAKSTDGRLFSRSWRGYAGPDSMPDSVWDKETERTSDNAELYDACAVYNSKFLILERPLGEIIPRGARHCALHDLIWMPDDPLECPAGHPAPFAVVAHEHA